MNKTRLIKKVIGGVLAEKGFKYTRCEFKIVWTFERTVGDVVQKVYLQEHSCFQEEFKLMFCTSAPGNGMKEIGTVLPEYEKQEYWSATTEEELIEVLEFFANFIREYGFDLLEDMLTEKPDFFETKERKQYFKEHREELVEQYDAIYHILGNGSRTDQLKHIDDVLYENRIAEETEEDVKRIYDLWLGMAAILIEIILDYQENATVNYDTYNVEIQFTHWENTLMPIFNIVQAWRIYHDFNDPSDSVVYDRYKDALFYKF